MSVTCKRVDWHKGMGVPTPVDPTVATEVLDYLFNTNTWKQNPDALIVKVRRWRERLWLKPPTPAEMRQSVGLSPEPEPDSWTATAVQMRRDGASWNQIKAVTGKSVSTIRDTVKRAGL